MAVPNDSNVSRVTGNGRSQPLAERLRLSALEERLRAHHRYLVLGVGEVGQQVVRSIHGFVRSFDAHGNGALYGAALTCSGNGSFDLTDITLERDGQAQGAADSDVRRGLNATDLPNTLRELIRRALQDWGHGFPQPDTILFVDVVYDLRARELQDVVEAVPDLVAQETGRSDVTLFVITDRRLQVTGTETSPAEAIRVAAGCQRRGYHRVYCGDSQDTRRLWVPDPSVLAERVAQFIAARCSPILSFHIRSGELASPGRVMPEHLVRGSFGVARLRGGLGEAERIVRDLVAEEMGASRSNETAADGAVAALVRETANWLVEHPNASQDEVRTRLRESLGRLAEGVGWRELVTRTRCFLVRLVGELEGSTVAFAFQLRRYQTDRALNQVIARRFGSVQDEQLPAVGAGAVGGFARGARPGPAGGSSRSDSPSPEGVPELVEQQVAESKLRRLPLCLPGLIPRKVAAALLAIAAVLATASALVPIFWASGGRAVAPIVAALVGLLVAAGLIWLEWGQGPYLVQLKPGRGYPYVRARGRYANWLGFVLALVGSLVLVWSVRVPTLLNFAPLALSFPLFGPLRFYYLFVPGALSVQMHSTLVSVAGLLLLVGVGTRLLWPDRAAGENNLSSAFGWRLPWLLGSLAAGIGIGLSSWQCWVATRWYLSWFQPGRPLEIALEVVGVLLQIGGAWLAAYRPIQTFRLPRLPVPPPPLRQPSRPSTDLVVAWARNLTAVGATPVPQPVRAQSIFDLICPGWAEQIADACLRELRGVVGSGLTERWAEELVREFGTDQLPRSLEEVLADSAVSHYLRGDYRRWLVAELLNRGRPLRLAADAIVPLQWPPGYFRPHRDVLLLVAPPRVVRVQLHQTDGEEREALLEFLYQVSAEETPVYAVRLAQGAERQRGAGALKEAEAESSGG